MTEFTWDSVVEFLNQNNVPETMLLVLGLVAIAMVIAYRSDKEGFLYKILVLIGVIAGAFMIYVALTVETGWTTATMIVITIASFTLIIRPFKDVNFALILSMMVMAIVYVWLGNLTGDLAAIATGWPRLIVAVAAGAILYMLTGYVQAVVQLFGKILNAWPFLFIIGVYCVIEAVFLLAGMGTVYQYIQGLTAPAAEALICL